jgi:hypothetical protein
VREEGNGTYRCSRLNSLSNLLHNRVDNRLIHTVSKSPLKNASYASNSTPQAAGFLPQAVTPAQHSQYSATPFPSPNPIFRPTRT